MPQQMLGFARADWLSKPADLLVEAWKDNPNVAGCLTVPGSEAFSAAAQPDPLYAWISWQHI